MSDGQSVYVYSFEYHDRATQTWIRGPLPATLEAIMRNGWRLLAGTGKLVFAELVDTEGVAFRA
jgi:hypothetical protein